jgi:hypothetical protein
MKTTITIFALALGINFANAQTVKEAEVPAAVKEALKKAYPTAKVEKWEKEEANYEAEIKVGKAESSVVYDASGNLVMTEVEIKVTELPKGVTDYINTNLKGKKAKEASKMTYTDGKVNYEAEVDDVDYIFDEKGNFIEKEKETDKKDDEKK